MWQLHLSLHYRISPYKVTNRYPLASSFSKIKESRLYKAFDALPINVSTSLRAPYHFL